MWTFTSEFDSTDELNRAHNFVIHIVLKNLIYLRFLKKEPDTFQLGTMKQCKIHSIRKQNKWSSFPLYCKT